MQAKEADLNNDGVISWDEALPFLTKLGRDKNCARDTKAGVKKELDPSQYTQKQLAQYFRRLFGIADKDGNGTLVRTNRCTIPQHQNR